MRESQREGRGVRKRRGVTGRGVIGRGVNERRGVRGKGGGVKEGE